jgi:hypothetical protein
MENHIDEVADRKDNFVDLDASTQKLKLKMKLQLNTRHFTAFEMLFIQNKPEQDVAKFLGFKSSEKKRSAGYKQIKNLKLLFQEKAKKIIEEEDVI